MAFNRVFRKPQVVGGFLQCEDIRHRDNLAHLHYLRTFFASLLDAPSYRVFQLVYVLTPDMVCHLPSRTSEKSAQAVLRRPGYRTNRDLTKCALEHVQRTLRHIRPRINGAEHVAIARSPERISVVNDLGAEAFDLMLVGLHNLHAVEIKERLTL